MIIRTRSQLIEWLEANAPAPYRQMLRDGSVEVMGLFNPLHDHATSPGWIVRVVSKCNTIRYLGISYTKLKRQIRCCGKIEMETVNWKNYIGDQCPDSPLNRGDHPHIADLAKREA